ncbi:MAG: hypothetical protein P4L87_07675 [Formivibrio sp.]|nr:hypothetical protein [Formivibrio sp.]
MKRLMRLYTALTVAALPIGTGAYYFNQITEIGGFATSLISDCEDGEYRANQNFKTESQCDNDAMRQVRHTNMVTLEAGVLVTTIALAILWFFGAILTYTGRWVLRGEK